MTVAVRRACIALTLVLTAALASGRLSPVWHGALIIVLTFAAAGWVHGAMRRSNCCARAVKLTPSSERVITGTNNFAVANALE